MQIVDKFVVIICFAHSSNARAVPSGPDTIISLLTIRRLWFYCSLSESPVCKFESKTYSLQETSHSCDERLYTEQGRVSFTHILCTHHTCSVHSSKGRIHLFSSITFYYLRRTWNYNYYEPSGLGSPDQLPPSRQVTLFLHIKTVQIHDLSPSRCKVRN